jgi:hypothetical protein
MRWEWLAAFVANPAVAAGAAMAESAAAAAQEAPARTIGARCPSHIKMSSTKCHFAPFSKGDGGILKSTVLGVI